MNQSSSDAILIVEQHTASRQKLEEQIAAPGHAFTSAENMKQAVEMIQGQEISVVFAGFTSVDEDFCRYVLHLADSRPALAVVASRKHQRTLRTVEADIHLIRPWPEEFFESVVEVLMRIHAGRRKEAELERFLAERGGALRSTDKPLSRFYHIDFFKHLLLVEVRRAKRYGYPLSILLLAVDPYPILPGKLMMAQKVRADVARAVSESIRDIDIPVYLGQEKVLLLLPHTDIEGAQKVGGRLLQEIGRKLSEPWESSGKDFRATASIGVAGTSRGRALSFSALMSQAKKALSKAQKEGGNLVMT